MIKVNLILRNFNGFIIFKPLNISDVFIKVASYPLKIFVIFFFNLFNCKKFRVFCDVACVVMSRLLYSLSLASVIS